MKKNLHPIVIDAFLADEFSKPAVSNTDYFITSALSNVLFDNLDPLDALIYPSVVFPKGLNFAISVQAYESKMKLIRANIVKINDILGYGIYDYKQVDILKSSDDDNLKFELNESKHTLINMFTKQTNYG